MPELINVRKTSPATTFTAGADLISQNVGGNYSTVRIYIAATVGPNGSTGSFFNDSGEQVISIDGIGGSSRSHSGRPFMPSGVSNGSRRWLDWWDINVPHNSDGSRGGVTIRMRLNYGSVRNEEFTGWFDNFPRLASVPSPPNIYSATNYRTNSFGMNYTRGNNNGAGIEQDHAQWSRTPDFSQVVWDDYGPGGYTDPRGNGDGPGPELAPATTYYVRVRSRNAVGWGGWSNTGSAATLGGVPDSIRFEQITPLGARLLWGGSGGTYDVEVSRDATGTDLDTITSANVPGTSFDLTGLLDADYRARVRSRNSAGVSAWSNWTAIFRPASAPPAPNVSPLKNLEDGAFRVTWTQVADGGAPLVGYTLRLATRLDFSDASTFDVGAVTEHTFTGLKLNTTFYVQVAARNRVTPAGWASLNWSPVQQITLALILDGSDGWTSFGGVPYGNPVGPGALRRGSVFSKGEDAPTGLLREIFSSLNGGAMGASVYGIQRTVQTVPGREYVFKANATALANDPVARFYKLGVMSIGTAADAEISDLGRDTTLPEFRFTATQTSHILRIYMSRQTTPYEGPRWLEAVAFFGVKLIEYRSESPYLLGPNVLESTLANHFSLACQSVGAAWWVDRIDHTRFREYAGEDAVAATFTDTRRTGHLEYLDAKWSDDTRNVRNVFEFTNHDIGPDGNAADVVFPTASQDSREKWGPRKGSVALNLSIPKAVVNALANPCGNDGTAYWWTPDTKTFSSSERLNESFLYEVQPHPAQVEGEEAFVRFLPETSTRHFEMFPLLTEAEGAGGFVAPSAMVGAGTNYIAAVEMRTNHPSALGGIGLIWRDSQGEEIDRDTVAGTSGLTDGWLRIVSAPISAPAGAVSVGIVYRLTALDLDFIPTLHTIDMTRAQFLPAAEDPGYLDGNSGYTTPAADGEGQLLMYKWGSTGRSEAWDVTDFLWRTTQIAEDIAEPVKRITSITWNAQENPALAARLDVQDRVTIIREGVPVTDYRIVGRRDEVTAGRWIVTFEVVPNEAA
ncbi:hypothetical protein CH252_40580 [Rhodococcus sp. 06-1477-1B]|nr:hypothetical protein CH252_40580 [Rhodococcus sp. 06-1477-1B]